MGGRASKGTPADKRLAANKTTSKAMPTKAMPKGMPKGMFGKK